MKFNEITENASAGATGSGSVASVASPMSTQSRNPSIYNGKKAGNLLTGKKSKGKYANSVQARKQMKINEAEQRADIVRYFRDFDDKLRSKYVYDWAVENNIDGNDAMEMAGYVKGAHSGGRHGSYMWYYQPDHSLNAIPDPKESVQEAEVLEQEVLVIPGTKRKDRKTGFVKHGESRVDHEVKMAKADLFATAKNAREIMECLKDRSEEELDLSSFVKFLHDRIKVNGKAGVLGDSVRIDSDKTKINVDAKLPFSKRYLKYLSKKYLKKQQLRDYLHVISTDKQTYQLRYFNITDTQDAVDEDDE